MMRGTMRFRALPLVTAIVALAALGGCGGSSTTHAMSTDGPLAGGSYGSISAGSVCAPASVGQPRTFGTERFANDGSTTVVLDRVALVRPHNERLVGSYAIPGNSLVGTAPWPPAGPGIPPSWRHHDSVHGFRLAPRMMVVIALGVAAPSTGRASSRGMVLYYHDSSGRYVLRNGLGMTIAVGKSC
jgi:hypothetical protein